MVGVGWIVTGLLILTALGAVVGVMYFILNEKTEKDPTIVLTPYPTVATMQEAEAEGVLAPPGTPEDPALILNDPRGKPEGNASAADVAELRTTPENTAVAVSDSSPATP